MNETMIIREEKDFIRIGDKNQLRFSKKESNYSKRVIENGTKICKIYNSKDELIAVDINQSEEEILTLIYPKGKKETIVIIEKWGMKFKGVTRCKDFDLFDAQKGHDIAKYRALIKAYEYKLKEHMEGI